MSEELKKKNPDPSRITIRQTDDTLVYGGELFLFQDGKEVARVHVDLDGTPKAPEHFVRVWIETECEVRENGTNTTENEV